MHLAVAWVLNHPVVTAAIIGPRTMEQLKSQIGAGDITLDAKLLSRIDEIVPPATNFSVGDPGYVSPPITRPHPRRRPG